MALSIVAVDGIIEGVGVAIDVDAREDRVPGVGREEMTERRVVVARVQVLQAGLGVVALVNVGFGDRRRAYWFAVGAIGDTASERAGAVGGEAVGAEVILGKI